MSDLLRSAIVNAVVEMNGGKELQVLARVLQDSLVADELPHHNFSDLIEDLVASGEIVEVNYILPRFSYKIKSFLLPGGTMVVK